MASKMTVQIHRWTDEDDAALEAAVGTMAAAGVPPKADLWSAIVGRLAPALLVTPEAARARYYRLTERRREEQEQERQAEQAQLDEQNALSRACLEHSEEHGDDCPCGAGGPLWDVSATQITCRGCGRVWGRVNGHWVMDPATVPPEEAWKRVERLVEEYEQSEQERLGELLTGLRDDLARIEARVDRTEELVERLLRALGEEVTP